MSPDHAAAARRLLTSPALALLVLLVCAVVPAGASNARALSLLAEGVANAQREDYHQAERRLTAALRADPDLALAHRWLGYVYRRQGKREEALGALARALALDPADEASRGAIAELLEGPFPRWLDRDTPPALPLRFESAAIRLTDPRLTDRAGVSQCLWTAEPVEQVAAVPRGHGRCDRALCGLLLDPAAGRWVLRFTVHYPSPALSAAGAEHRALAQDCLDLLLHSEVVLRAYLDPGRRRIPPVDVWLCEDGAPGGEAWSSHLLLYGIGTRRPPGEWARQLTHEFGHLAIPGINHYREPEAWANGRLGERLLIKWLLANPEARPRLLDRLDAAGHQRDRIAPLIAHLLAHGPDAQWADDASAAGMDWYLGLALYLEAALGPRALGEAMAATRGTHPADFLRAVERVMAARAQRGMAIDPAPGRDLWLYLPDGCWRVGDSEVSGGWQRIQAPAPPDTPLTVRRSEPPEPAPAVEPP